MSGFTIDEIEPRLFSFNNPFGACPDCDGLGVSSHFEAQLVVPDNRLSLRQGALAPWAKSTSKYYIQTLESLARTFNFSLDVPFEELDIQIQHVLLHGSGNQTVEMVYDDGLRSYRTTKPFEGLLPNLSRRYHETDSTGSVMSLKSFVRFSLVKVVGKAPKARVLAVRSMIGIYLMLPLIYRRCGRLVFKFV